ncbi:MAG: NAD-dependent epimerase/dehydratase family protein [Bacteroidota bacterium]
MSHQPYTPMPAILLTGGAGFLGKAIIHELLEPGSPLKPSFVRVFDLQDNPGFTDPRVRWIKGDIRDAATVHSACAGIDIVIHSAAVVDWGTKPEAELLSVNAGGTENIVHACLHHGVKCLVYTSSLDAIFGGNPMVDIDESVPYPERHPNAYCRSKYLAEKLILDTVSGIQDKQNANSGVSSDIQHPATYMLKSCILRPSDIWGEGDPYHIGSLIDMAKGGFYVRLGDGTSLSQHVYVGNMAWAHVLAADALWTENPKVAGNVYFITDAPPSNFFIFFERIVKDSGYSTWPGNFWIPRKVAYTLGALSELIAVLVSPVKKYTVKFSRFAVTYTCGDFTFRTEKAKQDFGFQPKYSGEESYERTISFYRKNR